MNRSTLPKASPAELLQEAVRNHRAGELARAEQLYMQVLAAEPNNAAAHDLLGMSAMARGNVARGVEQFANAVRCAPAVAEYQHHLGLALGAAGRCEDAYRTLLEATKLAPDSAETHLDLANSLEQLGDRPQAMAAYRRAIELAPSGTAAHRGLAGALYAAQQYEAAAASYREALRLSPSDVISHVGLGGALRALDRYAEAEACFRQALALAPDDLTARYNLGGVLFAVGDYPQAEEFMAGVLAQSPDDHDLRFHLAQSQAFQGKFDTALANFAAAIAQDPQNAEYHYYQAHTWLARGDFERGWPEYEWRLKTRYSGPPYPQPRWDGRPLDGQKIVLYAEWGVGDTVHFLRYVPLVQARGGDVFLEVQQGLIPLLEASGYRQCFAKQGDRTPEVAWQAPLLSLPGIFQTTLATIPAEIPYLKASPALVGKWRERLKPYAGLRVGIHWHGSKAWATDPRSIPLAEFERLAQVEGVTLVSLQKNDPNRELDELGSRWSIVDFGDELDAHEGAFMDTAAIMSQLDLVITCDTGTAHVAGALGVPTWVALPRASEWRWLWDREDSPWYPTMRLFRQPRPLDWRTPIERMARELGEMSDDRQRT